MTNGSKTLYYIKKTIFVVLLTYALCGFLFFLICTSFFNISIANRFLSILGVDDYFFGEGIQLTFAIFAPPLITVPILIWIFYRKETTLLCRIMITLMPVWTFFTFFALMRILDKLLSYNNPMWMLPAPGYIVIFIFLIKEITKYPRFGEAPDSAETA